MVKRHIMQVHTYVVVLVSSLGFCSCVLPESGGVGQIGVSGHSSIGGSISGSLGGATAISFGSNTGKTDIGGSTAEGMAGAGAGGRGFHASSGGSSTGGVASCDGGFISVGNDCVSIRIAGSDESI